jgi:hypothetical protein
MLSSSKHAYIGDKSIYYSDLKQGYVCHDGLMAGLPITTSRVVRHHLRGLLALTGRKRVGFNRQTYQMCFIPQPLYCMPPEDTFEGVYVDITAAFWNIYRHLSLDVFYDGEHLGNGAARFSHLPAEYAGEKKARNALIGITRARTQVYYHYGVAKQCPSHNPLLAPQLWGFIAHCLHEIAGLAVACGAVYVNTDGYIFPSGSHSQMEAFREIVGAYSLNTSIKASGQCAVYGVGRYEFNQIDRGKNRLVPFSNLVDISGRLELLHRVQSHNSRF